MNFRLFKSIQISTNTVIMMVLLVISKMTFRDQSRHLSSLRWEYIRYAWHSAIFLLLIIPSFLFICLSFSCFASLHRQGGLFVSKNKAGKRKDKTEVINENVAGAHNTAHAHTHTHKKVHLLSTDNFLFCVRFFSLFAWVCE